MDIQTQYKHILISNGITDPVSNVTIKDSGAKGDGLASVTQNVVVEFSKGRAPLQLFVKSHTDNPSHEEFLADTKAFEKEARFFMEYLPEAKKLCEKHGMNELLDIYPKCYYGDEKIIVLENVVLERGYEMMAHDIRHDFETAKLVLTSMAKYHALSHAVIQQYTDRKELFEKFVNFDYDSFVRPGMCDMMEAFFENSIHTTMIIAEKNLGTSSKDIVDRLKSMQGKCLEITLKTIRWNNNDPIFALIHGDFKNNNMMFRKNKETGKIADHLLIDFQMIRYNLPTIDVINYLYSSMDHKIRKDRLKELLEIYREALNNFTEKLQCPINLSFDDLFMQYRKKLGFGIMMALAMVGPGMGLMKDDNIDIDKHGMQDLAHLYRDNLIKWIDQHPEKGKEMAEEIVELLNHYKEFSISE